ncbi:MAG TPA: MtrB/PioB family decaheme-associated outer membrane protein [Burkholderiales bacterium]
MNTHQGFAFSLTALAAALLAAFGPARAEDGDEVKMLTTPTSEVSLGLGYVDNDNSLWGRYTGMTEKGVYGLLDFNVVTRNDETGLWTLVVGRNLGLEDRDFRFEQNRQGNWGYFLEYSQIPFQQPLTILTRNGGLNTAIQTLGGAAAPINVTLDTQREIFTVGANKILGMGFDFAVRYRNENKEGARRWGRQNPDFLAEPIDWQTNQLDAVVGYTSEKFQLLLGYYGTAFDNSNAFLTVLNANGTLAGGNNPLSLPPGNQSNQGYLSGGYNFTPTTRGNFKVAYTTLTQNQAFFTPAGVGIAGPFSAFGHTDLSGKVDTTQAEAGIVSRPLPELTLRADYRYDDRDDKTPRLQYVNGAGSRDGFNVPMSRTNSIARGEAQYLLPMGFRVIGGIEYAEVNREVAPTLRQVSWRTDTDEWSYWLEVNRSLSETLNGRLLYTYSDRNGSVYLPANNNVDPDIIDPIHWGDRTRDKWRLRLDWTPMDALLVQFTTDYAKDEYDGRPLGPESGTYRFYSLDANYSLSDNWQLVGWASYGDTQIHQRTIGSAAIAPPPDGTTGPREIWFAPLDSTSEAIGLGVRGKLTGKLEIGADFQYSEDKEEFNLSGLSSGFLGLPQIESKHTTVTLFGSYAVTPNSGVRLQYIYDRWSTNDWAWQINPFAFFTNNTSVFFDTPQQVNFIGATYYYKWQ